MKLPDSERSRVVLIGSSSYATDSGFGPLPTVRENLVQLANVLQTRTGIAQDNIRVVPDPTDNEAFLLALEPAAKEAEDLLLFYFAGHGMWLPKGGLGLTHSASKVAYPAWRTVDYDLVREVLIGSDASLKMSILDCCHSGNALKNMMVTEDPSKALEDLARVSGSYVLTATDGRKRWADSRGTNGCTAFTGALIDVLCGGKPDDPKYLTMDIIYPRLRAELIGRGLPAPQASGRNRGSSIALARNHLWAMAGAPADATTAKDCRRKAFAALDDQDNPNAELWFQKAAEGHDVVSMIGLALLMKDRGDSDRAELWFRKAADYGDNVAMANLGLLLKGRGCSDKAELWFREAAELGNSQAMRELGVLFTERGDLDEAEKWFRKGAELGNSQAINGVGFVLNQRDDLDEAEVWYRKSAEQGYEVAMRNLGVLLKARGEPDRADTWYRKSAKLGDADAMNGLGVLFRERGDLDEAEQWYRRAAELGNGNAMSNLGWLLKARGDLGEAEQWYRRAAELDNGNAINRLGAMF
uniref:caspase, EACC1-associated type n=1 Tax=Nocardia pseudovaccinii TaxID=189540 RepID=UPI000B1222E3